LGRCENGRGAAPPCGVRFRGSCSFGGGVPTAGPGRERAERHVRRRVGPAECQLERGGKHACWHLDRTGGCGAAGGLRACDVRVARGRRPGRCRRGHRRRERGRAGIRLRGAGGVRSPRPGTRRRRPLCSRHREADRAQRGRGADVAVVNLAHVSRAPLRSRVHCAPPSCVCRGRGLDGNGSPAPWRLGRLWHRMRGRRRCHGHRRARRRAGHERAWLHWGRRRRGCGVWAAWAVLVVRPGRRAVSRIAHRSSTRRAGLAGGTGGRDEGGAFLPGGDGPGCVQQTTAAFPTCCSHRGVLGEPRAL